MARAVPGASPAAALGAVRGRSWRGLLEQGPAQVLEQPQPVHPVQVTARCVLPWTVLDEGETATQTATEPLHPLARPARYDHPLPVRLLGEADIMGFMVQMSRRAGAVFASVVTALGAIAGAVALPTRTQGPAQSRPRLHRR